MIIYIVTIREPVCHVTKITYRQSWTETHSGPSCTPRRVYCTPSPCHPRDVEKTEKLLTCPALCDQLARASGDRVHGTRVCACVLCVSSTHRHTHTNTPHRSVRFRFWLTDSVGTRTRAEHRDSLTHVLVLLPRRVRSAREGERRRSRLFTPRKDKRSALNFQ